MAALTQTTIRVCNVDVDGDFSIEIEDGGDEGSMTLTIQRADDCAPVLAVPYMLPAAARALATALIKTADTIDG